MLCDLPDISLLAIECTLCHRSPSTRRCGPPALTCGPPSEGGPMSSEQVPAPPAPSPAELPGSADVVVIGAGHNGLVAAGYLAAAGLEVLVLEAGALPGGDTVTEELTLPGFAHDSCSSAHVLIQSNPLLRDDELALLSKHGLEYVHTDPAVVLPRDDGDSLVMHRDLDATADEIARWSPKDAVAFREMVGEWTGGLAAMHGRWSSGLELGGTDASPRAPEASGGTGGG